MHGREEAVRSQNWWRWDGRRERASGLCGRSRSALGVARRSGNHRTSGTSRPQKSQPYSSTGATLGENEPRNSEL